MNRKTFFLCCYIIPIILSLTSCYYGEPLSYIIPEPRQKENIYHNPSNANAPLLSKKNDMSLSYNYTASSDYSSSDVQAAYMPTDHVGLAINFSGKNDGYESSFPRWELGAGYVKQLSPSWHFETYAGFGGGHVENLHATGNSKFNTSHFYLQPAIATHNARNTLQLAFVSRFMQVHYNFKDSTFKADRERYTQRQVNTLINDPNHLFWEPGIMFKFGWQKLLFNLNYTISTHISGDEFDRIKNNFSAGITVKLNAGDIHSFKKTKSQ